ncbi:MAG: hypothetical protein BZ137_02995 [Methanosphaera sp. rholeuAM130]|nr:MAG: hypothetical protein BZ137_02995 [Methanosphaera sp. rholeuAM130]
MDVITVIIMFVLFLLAMIFVFSSALLTPYIGKKNLITVVVLGLVVGIVAGAFLAAPIVEDLPDFTRTLVEESVAGTDVVELELSTNGNITEIINNISSIEGVEKVDYNGITFKIDEPFSTDTDKVRFLSFLNGTNANITDIDELSNDTYYVYMEKDCDPQGVLDSIYYTFGQQTYTHLKYTSMQANATVKANNITNIISAIGENDAVVLNITGPTEDMINQINKYLPNQLNAVIFSGVLGVLVALAGFFVDSIFNLINNFRKKRNTSSDRERIKRKVVPGTENRQRRSRKVNKDSIDIFDDSFDDSPKQTIGSNKRFKQLTVEDLKEKTIKNSKQESDKKTKKGFSLNPFKKSSKNDAEMVEKDTMKTSKTNKRKAPHVRPKRK